MIDQRARSRRRTRGFTLLELGIVIGVAAILAAAIVPDLLETMRNRMAEKAAADLALIHDAGRLFYVQNTVNPNRWPGENFTGFCTNAFSPGKVKLDLLNGGYLTSGAPPSDPMGPGSENFMRNPWKQMYEVSLYAPSGTTTSPACLFGVSTDIPDAVSDGFISFLPQAGCNKGGATPCPNSSTGSVPPAGFVRCCSFVPKPGATIDGPCTTPLRMVCNTTKCWCAP